LIIVKKLLEESVLIKSSYDETDIRKKPILKNYIDIQSFSKKIEQKKKNFKKKFMTKFLIL